MRLRVSALVENLAGTAGVWAEHGLSLLIETREARVLLDTGASGQVLSHNVQYALKTPVAPLDSLVLSHGHTDHTGGLSAALDLFSPTRVFAHTAVFEPRIARRGEQLHAIGIRLTREQIDRRARLTLSAMPEEVAPGVWTTGEITERPHEMSGASYLFVERDGQMIPDTYTDDMSMVVKVAGGLVLVLGGCHAGLLNTMRHSANRFHEPILAVVGGTHLGGIGDVQLQALTRTLQSEYGTPKLFLNHCTSPDVVVRLGMILGKEQVRYLPCGDTIAL